jgi:hypothetical protein
MGRTPFLAEIMGVLTSARMPILQPLHCFFDESGKLDTEYASMGGVCLTALETQRVTAEWTAVLEDNRLLHTSMKEALSLSGPYEGREPKERNKILRHLAGVLLNNRVICIACAVANTQFGSLSESDKRKLWGKIYYPTFEACLLGCMARGDVSLYFDLAEEFSEKCVKLFHRIRKRNPAAKARCFGISFQDDEVCPCLQMADMIAYCARTSSSQYTRDPIVDELASKLMSDRRQGTVMYYEPGELGDAFLEWDMEK